MQKTHVCSTQRNRSAGTLTGASKRKREERTKDQLRKEKRIYECQQKKQPNSPTSKI